MTDHTHPDLAPRSEVNGFGQRVGRVEYSQAEERTKTKRNEQDIQDLFKLIGDNAKTQQKFQQDTIQHFGQVEATMTASVGAVAKNVSNLKYWILGGLAAGGAVLGFLLKAGVV